MRGRGLLAAAVGLWLAAFARDGVDRWIDATVLPPLDEPLITGSLGFLYHTGKHVITEGDWRAFFAFAGRHFGVTGR